MNIVYQDERYSLGWKDELPFIKISGKKYKLACHPYEPCLYITDEDEILTAVHNSFDPSSVLQAFSNGELITSITGREYDAKDFCLLVEYAAGKGCLQIDEAERVFGEREKKKKTVSRDERKVINTFNEEIPCPTFGKVIEDDLVFDLLSQYPDSVVDWCLVKTEYESKAHLTALYLASRKLFLENNGEPIWQFDISKAKSQKISADELFSTEETGEKLSYCKAFLRPPHTVDYTEKDFERINSVLFPNGTKGLEVLEWTTDWSEYFDEGHEWWGALCLTVYDKTLERFAVIMASATD